MDASRWTRLEALHGAALLLLGGFLASATGSILPARSAVAEEAGEVEAAETPPPGKIRFVGKNRVATANSIFHVWKITRAEIDPENLADGFVEIEIDVASLDTGIPRRDDHLRTDDFFDVARFPTATVRFYEARPLEAESEAAEEGDRYTAKMDLRIRDIEKTQDVEFVLLDPDTFRVRGEFTILRTDFGVGEPYRKLNPLSVQDEVKLSFEATLLGDS